MGNEFGPLRKPIVLAVVVISALLFPGCRSTPYFGFPEFCPSIQTETQRRRAARFDPFPDPNIGPGMKECRPHEYQDPTPFKSAPQKGWFANKTDRYSDPFNSSNLTCPRPSYQEDANPRNSSRFVARNGYIRPDCDSPVCSTPPQSLPPPVCPQYCPAPPAAACPRQPIICVPEGYECCPNACF